MQSEQSDLFQQNPQVPGTLIWRDSAARFQVLGKLSDTLTALVNVHVRLFDGPDSYGGGNLVTPVPGQSEFSSPAFRNSTETQTADGVTLTLNKVFDSGNILTSITDRSNYGESQAGESGTGVTTDSGLTRSKWDVNQFSQEFRLTSPAEQQLSWILGAYYFNGSIASDSENGTFSNLNQTSSAITAAAYGDDTYGIKNTDYAVFGHGDWKFNQKLDLALGLRYTIDQKTGSLLYASNLKPTAAGGITTGTNGNNIVTTSSPTDWWNPSNVVQTLYTVAQDSKSRTWNGLTYDITPSYQVTDDLKVYFRNAKSFNAGNFNATATTQATVATIEPEYVNSFEIGEKSQWLNNRLTVDGDVFYYLYTNIQQKVQVVNPVQANASVTSFTNNADGIGEGVELSITYLPTDNLKLSTNIGLNETRFTFFPLIQLPLLPRPVPLAIGLTGCPGI
ncbi:MAG: TonB-dependent receptor [Nitrosomonadales bacterium]